ncbi:MAG: class I SAM-dependent methyltransferase [Pseudomonadota bacterium]|nr:class I SAM-dependent methyltransferase [Pseudomonadota bacterium]
MSPTKNKLNKKSKMPFNINRKSILGVLSLIYQEIIDSFLTKTKIKKSKELEVLELVKKKAIKNNPNSILKIIDDYAYKSTFLMNIGDQKGEILDKAIKDSRATNILELGVYLGYSTIRILNNMMDNSKLTSIEANEKFAQIAKEHIEISGLSKNHILKIGKSSDLIPSLEEQYDFVFIDHWKDLYLKDLQLLEQFGLLKQGAWVFADNVVLFNLEDYLDYVRSSPDFKSEFIPTMREYSKSHPDGVEISKYKL